jgi:hypothetical protein
MSASRSYIDLTRDEDFSCGSSSIQAMPTEGSLYQLDTATAKNLSQLSEFNHADPNYLKLLNSTHLIKKTNRVEDRDHAIMAFNRKGELMFQEFWCLYEDTFKRILIETWQNTPIDKKIYNIDLVTKCYTSINNRFTEVYFGVPFTFTWELRQRHRLIPQSQ